MLRGELFNFGGVNYNSIIYWSKRDLDETVRQKKLASPSAGETIYNLVVPRTCLEIVNPKKWSAERFEHAKKNQALLQV